MEQQYSSVKSRWLKLDGDRSSVLARARECSALTIPSLLPPLGHTEGNALPTPYQGLGARGVNNLASKLLITLLPPNSPFFRLSVDDFTLEEITRQPGMRAEVEEGLNKIERAVTNEIEVQALRVPSFEALKHLIVTGNVLEYLPDSGGMKVYRLDQYCVKRDPMGKVMEIIIREEVYASSLPEAVKAEVTAAAADPDKTSELFTYVRFNPETKLWEVRQEVGGGIVIPDSEGTYPEQESPWIPLRWTAIANEDYGRGLVEEYLGDLKSLEALTQAIVEGSAAAAKVLFLVDPNGTTRAKKIAKAKSGDIVDGNAKDVSTLQMDKFADFQVALQTAQKIENRLAQAFLLMSAIQRDAERVTAEEIRNMVKELEDSLGGVYSVLSQEKQLPLVRRLMAQMSKKKKLPKLPQEIIQPMVVTGLEALGRGNDLNKLILFIQQLAQVPEAIQYLNIGDFVKRVGTALGIDMSGLIKSAEEIVRLQQQATLMNMGQATLPGVAKEVAKGMMAQPAPNPQS